MMIRNFFTRLADGLLYQADNYDRALSRLLIIKSRRGIRRELLEAQLTGKAVGICTPALGQGMFLCGVERVISNSGDEEVILKPYDMNGSLLAATRLAINDIKSLCPFDSYYLDPLLLEPKRIHDIR